MNTLWKKIDRELNVVADRLAKDSHIISGNSVIFETLPNNLVNLLSLYGCGLVTS